jgi:hypothetical protein
MATSTDLEDAARSLSEVHADRAEAVDEFLRLADGRRVSLVVARRRLSEGQENDSDDELTKRAIALIEAALERGSWSE